MIKRSEITRRQFVGSAVSAAALTALPVGEGCLRAGGSSLSFSTLAGSPGNPEWKDEGVLNLAKSPYAKLRNVPVHAVTITSGFWGTRRQTNVEKSIPSMEKLLEGNGRMDNFLRLAGKSDAPQKGPVFSDSDLYTWSEAVGFGRTERTATVAPAPVSGRVRRFCSLISLQIA